MDDILAKKNKHLFLEEKDNQNNSFIRNINYAVENIDTIKTFNDNVNNGTIQHLLEAYIEQVGVEGNAWVVRLTEVGESILATTSGFNYSTVVTISSDIPANGTLILPTPMKYKVGTHMLMISWNGTVCYAGEQYEELGVYGAWSTSIKLKQSAKIGDKIQLRTVALVDQASYADITEAAVNASQIIANGSNTERYLSEFLGDIVNVKNFGAVGNGIIDDSAAVSNALAIAKVKNAILFFPAGTYSLQSTVVGLLLHKLCGDGVLKRGLNEYHISNAGTHRNFIYCAPAEEGKELDASSGDGLSASSPVYLGEAVKALKNYDLLRGIWTVKLAAGTYRTCEQYSGIKTETTSTLTIQGNTVETGGSDDKSLWTWDTKLVPYSTAAYANIIYIGNTDSIVLKNLWFEHSHDIENGTAVAFAYGCSYCLLDTCKIEKATWSGVIFQNVAMGSVKNCLIDGVDKTKCRYGINYYNTFGNTNSGSGTRNTIANYSVGMFGQGGRAYVHNDYNDFVNCATAITGDFGAHVEDNYNTFEDCTHKHRFRFGGKGITREAFDSSFPSFVQYGFINNETNQAYQYYPGVYYCSLGTKGRKSLFESSLQSVFSRLTVNLGDADMSSVAKARANDQFLLYNSTDSRCKLGLAGDTACQITFRASKDLSDLDAGNPCAEIISSPTYRNIALSVYPSGSTSSVGVIVRTTSLVPSATNTLSLGASNLLWSNVYATTGPWASSDARLKDNIASPSEALMKAWGKVRFKIFQMKDAIASKGEAKARIHVGVIAQEVQEAFASEGLDVSRYGLFGYDSWDDEYQDVEIVDAEAVFDNNGKVVSEQKSHVERQLTVKAGERFSIRYEEALALECVYQRWLGEQRDAKIEALMQRISALENNR